MTQAVGVFSKLNMGFEGTFKSSPTDGFILPVNSSGIKASRAKNSPETIRGNRNAAEPFDGNLEVSGSIVVPVDSLAFWYWLKAMFGVPTTTGSSSPYTHEFKVGNSMPSIAIENQFTNIATPLYALFNGCKIKSFKMDLGGDGELTASIDVAGAKQTIGTSSFDATPTTIAMSRLKNSQVSITEGGTTLPNGTKLSINVDFGLDTSQYVIGSGGELGAIPEGIVKVSGNLTTLFEDATLLTKAINSTESNLVATISAGSASQLIIELNELQYALTAPTIDGPKGIQASLDFQAYYTDGTDASAIVATLINSAEHAGGI